MIRAFEDIEVATNLAELVAEMKVAYATGRRAGAQVPLRSVIVRERPYGAFAAMPAYSAADDLFVTKVGAVVPQSNGRQSVHSVVVAFSGTTGQILATLDGSAITNLKCAAVTALVTDFCAPAQARTFALFGTGVQAREQLRAVCAVRNIEEVRVVSRDPRNVARFIEREARAGLRFVTSHSAEAAVDGADVISTATTSVEALFSSSHLQAGVHINAFGAHTVGSREVTHDLLRESVVVVEDKSTAIAEAGDIHERAIELEQLATAGDLHTVRTVFSSTGHAFLDLLTVAHTLRALGIR